MSLAAPFPTALEREAVAWKETAALHCRNEQYYRSLVQAIGEAIGHDAYVSDDGSVQQDVLCAKVPDLVNKLIAERDHFKSLHNPQGS